MLTASASWRNVRLAWIERSFWSSGAPGGGKLSDRTRSCPFFASIFASSPCWRPRPGSRALALANIALAIAQFVEPILFGHIVDALSGALPAGAGPAARALAPLIGVWVGFGLFIIIAGALVAWFADRLAHRRRNLVLADFFEHVLQLPLSYHAGAHSGRQLKIMLTGTDTLWWLWVSFFREHFAAFVFIAVLLPTTMMLNWRLALPLLALCVVFTALTVLVMRKATPCSARSSGIIPI